MREKRIYALHCGGDVSDFAIFDPQDERAGTELYNPYFMYVITHPSGVVLFDSGVHPDVRTDPVGRLGDAAATFAIEVGEGDSVRACLARIGLTPADIDHVVQSHLHFDHAGGLEWLTHADVHVQRAELDFARSPSDQQRDIYVRADFEHDLRWRVHDGEHDLFGDGSLRLIPTPGHTPGHQSLLVALGGQTVFLLADAAYLVEKLRIKHLPGLLWNAEAMLATWGRIEAIEAEHDALLVATHELDFRDRVRLAPGEWYA